MSLIQTDFPQKRKKACYVMIFFYCFAFREFEKGFVEKYDESFGFVREVFLDV